MILRILPKITHSREFAMDAENQRKLCMHALKQREVLLVFITRDLLAFLSFRAPFCTCYICCMSPEN